MKVLGRGLSEFMEITDTPPAPPTPSLTLTRTSGVPGDASAALEASAAASHAAFAPALSIPNMVTPSMMSASTDLASLQSGASLNLAPVVSALTDLLSQGVVSRGGETPAATGGGGGDGVARGDSSLPPMLLSLAAYAENGWFIVPSASNEYGESQAAAAGADEFVWDIASGEFSADWFFV